MTKFDPNESFANLRHEFGEHGGVNMSVEASTTFTVIEPKTMPEIFGGQLGPDVGGCYLYGRHFNPTVYVLGRQIAAYEGANFFSKCLLFLGVIEIHGGGPVSGAE